MRKHLRHVMLCTLAVVAAGCTNHDKPSSLEAPISGVPGMSSGLSKTLQCTVDIGDRVWFDVNCNGIQDKDETGGPEGLKVTLINCNDETDVHDTLTDANGNYLFDDVEEGEYRICFEIPGGFVTTLEDEGSNDGLDSDVNEEGCTGCRTYECDKPDMTRDAGLCEKKGEVGCRFTGGGNSEFEGDAYTFGGQAGANTALQPQPAGEWEHNQHSGPNGSFAFHGGTHSAPDGTEIDRIECTDPGWCKQARHAPAHQLDFWGVGQFHAAKNLPADLASEIEVGESLHWFEVNIDDAGEPGKETDADCPEDGFGLHGSEEFVNCDCGDFYRITIHATTDPASDVIYTVHGYFTGNFQIHPLTGYDLH